MADLITNDKLEQFAAYADKHSLYDTLRELTAKLLLERPVDPFQFMIDHLRTQAPIILFAPPASGVHPLGTKLAEQLDCAYIIAAEVIQANIFKQTSLGIQSKPYVEKGLFVPDEIVTTMILGRLNEPDVKERGYVLEGFPRTKGQVINMVREKLCIDHISINFLMSVEFDMENQKIVDRAQELRFDPVTNKIYHLKDDPPPSNVFIQKRLTQKMTDQEPLLGKRLALYRHQIREVVNFYKEKHRRFFLSEGFYGHVDSLLPGIVTHINLDPKTAGPRLSKIILGGLPGSGRQVFADHIEAKYGHVHVSPSVVIKEQITARSKEGVQLAQYVDDTELAPLPLIGPLIVKRLQRQDCKSRGWVLEGFPRTAEHADFLAKAGIEPNRLIWFNSSVELCQNRLTNRRDDPSTGRVAQIDKLPHDLTEEEVSKWSSRSKDISPTHTFARFDMYTNAKSELKSFYKPRTQDVNGLFYEINDIDGDLDNVFDRAEASLLRPIPKELGSKEVL